MKNMKKKKQIFSWPRKTSASNVEKMGTMQDSLKIVIIQQHTVAKYEKVQHTAEVTAEEEPTEEIVATSISKAVHIPTHG